MTSVRETRATSDSPGFTLIEIAIAIVVLGMVLISAFSVLRNSSRAKEAGDSVSEAQQNARVVIDAIIDDLRQAGFNLDPNSDVPIEVASEYRITLVSDKDASGTIDFGERITYFLDPDQTVGIVDRTSNPYDYVVRRVQSTSTNPSADPDVGAGSIVAYLVTQRSKGATSKDTPLFTYRDESGTNLIGAGNDPFNAQLGKTVADDKLGLPVGGSYTPQVDGVEVSIVTETPNATSGSSFRRVALSSTIRPRNFGLSFGSLASVIDTTGSGGYGGTGNGGQGSGGAPPDTTGQQETGPQGQPLPTPEAPVRVSVTDGVALALENLDELDSYEGSSTQIDGQQDLDLVVATESGNSQFATYYNGQPGLYSGDALYSSTPQWTGIPSGTITSLALGDLDDDGMTYHDLVTGLIVGTNLGGFEVFYNQKALNPGKLGKGPGSSPRSHVFVEVDTPVRSVALADFDNDGIRDVILGTGDAEGHGSIQVWRHGTVRRDLTLYTEIEVEGWVVSLAPGDMNLDGWTDVVAGVATGISYGTVISHTGAIEIFTGNTATLTSQSSRATGVPWGLEVEDMNADGYPDVVSGVQYSTVMGGVEFWYCGGTGVLPYSRTDYAAADGPVLCLAVGNLDLQPEPDVAVGTATGAVQAWYTRTGEPYDVFGSFDDWRDLNAGGDVSGIEIGLLESSPQADPDDIDFLGDIVVVTGNGSAGELIVYRNPYVGPVIP